MAKRYYFDSEIYPVAQMLSSTSLGAATPSYSFDGDADTGMYRYGVDAIGFANGGVVSWTIGLNGQLSCLRNPSNNNALSVSDNSIQFVEMTDPTAGPANTCYLYCRDTGGKTELVAQFNTGAIQQVAIQP